MLERIAKQLLRLDATDPARAQELREVAAVIIEEERVRCARRAGRFLSKDVRFKGYVVGLVLCCPDPHLTLFLPQQHLERLARRWASTLG